MHQIKSIQKLPISLVEAWTFFSSPQNLALITPKELGLVPLSELPKTMYPGMFIAYKVRPLFGIPMTWITEITHVQNEVFFVDEQRIGPYKIWHHEHHFKAIKGGVEMLDIVTYVLPLGILGDLAHALFVKKQVQQIFDFREQKLIELFGKWS